MLYCCQAWSGFCSAADRQQLDSFIRRCIKVGYCAPDTRPIETLFIEADENLFCKVLRNRHHTLYPLLPPPADRAYDLHQRKHNRSLITKSSALSENNFIIRLLYRDIYWRTGCINVCSFLFKRF